MNLSFKPLEESVTRLALAVKKEDIRGFERESKVFYEQMGVLAKYHWLKGEQERLCNHYQLQYAQLKWQITQNQRR